MSIASGSVLTELIQGRTIPDCLALAATDLVVALDGVPPDKLHGPALAIGALHDALSRPQSEVPVAPPTKPLGMTTEREKEA